MRIAINGFGRIGRLVLRRLLSEGIEVVAINDLNSLESLCYFYQFDTVHGRVKETVSFEENVLCVGNQRIEVFSKSDPSQLPWGALGVDYVIEASGRFKSANQTRLHLSSGAKRVIVTAPSPDLPTLVCGVNLEDYDPHRDFAVSNGSCTTNCLAPIARLLDLHYGIEEGLMTTIHAATASQAVVDGGRGTNLRLARSVFGNMIPSSTGADKALSQCYPALEGKITGMAFRVPVLDVSALDFTVRLKRAVSYGELCEMVEQESLSGQRGIIAYSKDPLVSSDLIGSTYSSIFDSLAGIALNDRFFKLIMWYDNEMGYSSRVVDLARHMDEQEN